MANYYSNFFFFLSTPKTFVFSLNDGFDGQHHHHHILWNITQSIKKIPFFSIFNELQKLQMCWLWAINFQFSLFFRFVIIRYMRIYICLTQFVVHPISFYPFIYFRLLLLLLLLFIHVLCSLVIIIIVVGCFNTKFYTAFHHHHHHHQLFQTKIN